MLVDILNPEVIVIGSIFARDRELMESAMFEVLQRESLKLSMEVCKILPSELQESLGDIAAVSVAVNGMQNINCCSDNDAEFTP
ncbi:MAG: hypothetical protein LBU32_29430 [Clostridiales bacterium]|jgi:glucokinase|nr:hypothetical protein [Clostridiales bacterium]